MSSKSSLETLLSKNIFFNLYNPNLESDYWEYDAEILEEWDEIYGAVDIDYRNHLYGFIFPSPNGDAESEQSKEAILRFFEEQFKGIAFGDAVYPAFGHRPTIGIYNALNNELIAIGLGRKNRVFTLGFNLNKSKEPIVTSISEKQLNYFTRFDYANITPVMIQRLEDIGSLHEEASSIDVEEDGEDERDQLFEDMNDYIGAIRDLIPTTPDIDELSPGDL